MINSGSFEADDQKANTGDTPATTPRTGVPSCAKRETKMTLATHMHVFIVKQAIALADRLKRPRAQIGKTPEMPNVAACVSNDSG